MSDAYLGGILFGANIIAGEASAVAALGLLSGVNASCLVAGQDLLLPAHVPGTRPLLGAGVSSLLSGWVAKKIGLVKTMVFT